MATIKEVTKKSSMKVFRRLFMKRRETDGEYETDWQTIPSIFIKKWGGVQAGTSDVLQSFFKFSGFNFTCENNTGFFSDTTDDKSFFAGKLDRIRTLVKVEAGYTAETSTGSDVELPTSPTIFVGLIREDMAYRQDNLVNFKVNHLSSIFQETPADAIAGLGSTQSASDIITAIKNYTDGSNVLVFQKYISSGGWNITATTNQYNMATTSTLQGKSCWDLMRQLSEAENFIVYIDRLGDFHFKAKTEGSSITAHFSGPGDTTDKTWGKNVLANISVDQDVRNVFNRVEITFDTTSSLAVNQETWAWGDSSSSFRYGVRTFKYSNDLMGTTTASTVGDNIFNEFQFPKQKVKVKTKFMPHLNVLDLTEITYKTQVRSGEAEYGTAVMDVDFWGERAGLNIEIDGNFKVWSYSHNIGNFTTQIELRSI